MVARQSLTLFVKVRILVPQPNPGSLKEVRGFFCVYTKNQGGTLVFRPGFYSVSITSEIRCRPYQTPFPENPSH